MCVTYSVRAHCSWQSRCMPQTSRHSKAARLSWKESDVPVRIITPPPDTERHFKSTRPPPPPRLSYSLIALVQEEITVLFHFLTFSVFSSHTYTRTDTLQTSPCFPCSVRWPFICHSTVSTSLKTWIIFQGCFVLPPQAVIYRSSSHCISDKYLHGGSVGAHVSCTVGMLGHPLVTDYCRGRVLVVCKALCWNRLKSKCQHWSDTGRSWVSSLKKLTVAVAMTVTQQISFKVKFNKPLKIQDEKKIPHQNTDIITFQKSAHGPD